MAIMHPSQRRVKQAGAPPPPNYNQPYDPYGYPDPNLQPNQNYGYGYPSLPAQGMPPQQQWAPGPDPYQPSPPMGPLGGGANQFVNEQMANMMMQYGGVIAGQGTAIAQQKIEKYITYFARLKYYFAVDTNYVAKKLLLLFFPFTHKNWAVQFNDNEPIAPRYEINAPDLYIPSMAFVTYVLTAGYLLGLSNKFSPEQLGKQASSAMGWVSLEIILVLLMHYLFSITSSSLKLLDIIAFCSYKFVCIISMLLGSLLIGHIAYYALLIYTSLSLGFFLMRTMRVAMLKNSESYSSGNKRTLYLVLFVCVCQPLMMYWLTYHLINIKVTDQ